ncbi:phage tail protein [Pedobacter arcticus]|uniref:phage tail protein n=1 Tax=Pedobacter arcticus TaxID=752140 RepID=UPI0002F6F16C|nr:phage tail protein [Pedobacter arcticus]
MLYQFYRPTSGADLLIKEVYPTGSQSPEAMGADVVDMAFELPEYIDFRINDFCMVYGKKYKINRTPTVTKEGNRHYIYKVQLEAHWYDLAKASYQFLNPANDLLEQDFSLMGNALTFVTLAVQNANRQSPGWTVGVVDDTDYKNLPFNKQNCLQVLHQLAQVFETELWIDNQVVHLTKREVSSGYTFEYGKGKGLNSVTRQNKTDINIFTRLYVRGGSTNLPTGYGSDALLMPGGDYFLEDPAKVAMYGFAEDNEEFTDIFPKREGTVTGVTAGDDNWMYLFDTALDFDINEQASPVGDAKIAFNTGQLAGYTFTIGNYNHATKRITINKNTEETNLDIPSNTLRPGIGDKYVLIDIIMPTSYVTAAEQLLKDTAQIHYDKGSDPKFQLAYSAVTDTLFMKANNIDVVLGTTAILLDNQIGINSELRIAKYTRDLQNPDLYTNIVWSDTIGANEIIRQYQQQKRTLQLLESSGLLDINQLRKNIFLNRLSESEGYLYLAGQKIKAGLADLATNALHADLADYALDADKWDGRDFADYLDQPVRVNDDVRFKSISSPSFVSGALGSGFRIDEYGNATFDNLTVRKEFNVYELVLNKISGTNGALAVTDTIKIDTVTETIDGYDCTIDTGENTVAVPFQVNDLVRCQVFNGTAVKYYFAQITAVGSGTFTIVKAGKVGAGIPAPGDTVVRFGNTTDADRQGLLYLTASDSGAPYLDVLDGVTSDNLTGKTKVRLGKLDGIIDADLGALSGYGLYGQNVYVKGKVHVTGGNAQTIAGSQVLANVAEANAISLASSDAQTKANLAQANAAVLSQQLVNGVKIGGRNLILNSANITTSLASYFIEGFNDGEEVTLQMWGRGVISLWADNGWTNWSGNLDTRTGEPYCKVTQIVNPYTSRPDKNNGTVLVRLQLTTAVKIKLERGNKATDWTPAPEDVQTAIDTANALAQTAQNSYNALTASLKSMAYQDVVELSKLGSTLIEGGKIKTTLLDADYIRANVVNAGYINTLELSASVIKSGTIDSARINASQILVNAGGATTAQVATAKTEAITSATTQAQADATAKASAAQSAAISAAAADATAKANTAQGNASADAQTKATAAQTAAENYATAQSAYEREIAKAYADGIVSAEELARIADVSAKLQLAKDDATAKVTAVQAVVNGYTDTKSLATLSSAQSYADASATSKANVAQANAVSLASSDAQTKADAAQAAAAVLSQQLVDGVKIGGRNYFGKNIETSGWSGNDGGFGSINYTLGYLRLSSGSSIGIFRYINLTDDLLNTQLTFSFDAKSDVDLSHAALYFGSGNIGGDFNFTTNFKRYSFTFSTPVNNQPIIITSVTPSRVLHFKNIKLEKGNKATDWTPAPEDVQSAIDTANALAVTAQNNYTALTASLKSMAYQDVVELSKLGSTLIEGGKIKTTLLDADYIRANIVNADYVRVKVLEADFIPGIITDTINADYINALEIVANTIEAVSGTISGFVLHDNFIKQGDTSDYIMIGGESGGKGIKVSKDTKGYVDISAGTIVASSSTTTPALVTSGNAIMYGLPTTATMTGFKYLVIKDSDSKIYIKT